MSVGLAWNCLLACFDRSSFDTIYINTIHIEIVWNGIMLFLQSTVQEPSCILSQNTTKMNSWRRQQTWSLLRPSQLLNSTQIISLALKKVILLLFVGNVLELPYIRTFWKSWCENDSMLKIHCCSWELLYQLMNEAGLLWKWS